MSLLCCLRLLDVNFQKYLTLKNGDVSNQQEETSVLLRIEKNKGQQKWDAKSWTKGIQNVTNCVVAVHEVIVNEETESESKTESLFIETKENDAAQQSKLASAMNKRLFDVTITGKNDGFLDYTTAFELSLACRMVRESCLDQKEGAEKDGVADRNALPNALLEIQKTTHNAIFQTVLSTLTAMLNHYEAIPSSATNMEMKEDANEGEKIVPLSSLVVNKLIETIAAIPVALPLVDLLIVKCKQSIDEKLGSTSAVPDALTVLLMKRFASMQGVKELMECESLPNFVDLLLFIMQYSETNKIQIMGTQVISKKWCCSVLQYIIVYVRDKYLHTDTSTVKQVCINTIHKLNDCVLKTFCSGCGVEGSATDFMNIETLMMPLLIALKSVGSNALI